MNKNNTCKNTLPCAKSFTAVGPIRGWKSDKPKLSPNNLTWPQIGCHITYAGIVSSVTSQLHPFQPAIPPVSPQTGSTTVNMYMYKC